MNTTRLLLLLLVVTTPLALQAAAAATHADQPRELGAVHWGRDLDKALAAARTSGRPVLLLFQEIPGCDGCVQFGDQPLSNPLVVEAIESEFHPIVVRNNVAGEEAKILKRFNEPAQNFPVMRFLNADGRDIVERQDNIFTTHDVSKRLIEALAIGDRPVPEYLKIGMLESDTSRDHRERLTFAMHCFWDGEARLGAITGVVATRAVMYEKHEAVEVVFDPTIVSIEDLTAAADKAGCADAVYAHGDIQLVHAQKSLGERAFAAKSRATDAPIADQRHALAQSNLRWLPLTSMQSMKVNSALVLGDDPGRFLTPSQRAQAEQIDAALARNPKALDGLTPPKTIDQWPAYQQVLRRRLK